MSYVRQISVSGGRKCTVFGRTKWLRDDVLRFAKLLKTINPNLTTVSIDKVEQGIWDSIHGITDSFLELFNPDSHGYTQVTYCGLAVNVVNYEHDTDADMIYLYIDFLIEAELVAEYLSKTEETDPDLIVGMIADEI